MKATLAILKHLLEDDEEDFDLKDLADTPPCPVFALVDGLTGFADPIGSAIYRNWKIYYDSRPNDAYEIDWIRYNHTPNKTYSRRSQRRFEQAVLDRGGGGRLEIKVLDGTLGPHRWSVRVQSSGSCA
jgi:RimJ/RimL family protein N-acetyltransferase